MFRVHTVIISYTNGQGILAILDLIYMTLSWSYLLTFTWLEK